MAMEATHSTIKDDKGQVTHYDILVDGALVGKANKTEKGKFNFTVHDGAGKDLADMKTMRDLKVEVLKNVPAEFVKANQPEPKPAKEKKAKKTDGDPIEKELGAEDHEASEDIDLA